MTQPQPLPYEPSSRKKYEIPIIVGIVALLIGVGVGYVIGISTQQKFTFTHGTLYVGSRGYADSIDFVPTSGSVGTLNAVAKLANNYQLYLVSGKSYTITLYYVSNSTTYLTIDKCSGRPEVFTPSGADQSQDFVC